jgi:RimJ/RimL family protein N-acetyltransferase
VICHGYRGFKWQDTDTRFLHNQLAELRAHRRVASNRLSSAVFYGAAAGCEPAVYGDPMQLDQEDRPTAERIRRRCDRAETQWLGGTRADLVIEDAATGEPVGDIGLFYDDAFTQQAMIGYSMLPAYRGRGFPTRAAQLLSLWVFAETDVVRLIAGAAPDNLASQRVLEKAGFHREAYLRARLPGPDGTRADDVQYVLLAEDLLN